MPFRSNPKSTVSEACGSIRRGVCFLSTLSEKALSGYMTPRGFDVLKLNRGCQVCWIWALKPTEGSRRGRWRHRRACVETKRLHEGYMSIRCLETKWTILPPVAK